MLLLLVGLCACGGESGSPDDREPDETTPCVEGGCPDGTVCDGTVCVEACPAGRITCGETCCAAGEVCGAAGCVEPLMCPGPICGTICCAAGEVCEDGACQAGCPTVVCDGQCCAEGELCVGNSTCCPAGRTCGAACCGSNEDCVAGQCIVLGPACDPAGASCATRPDVTGCPDGQTCDPELRRCVPDRSDASCTFEPPVGEFEPVPLFTWGRRLARECDDNSECQTNERCEDEQCVVTWPHVEPVDLPDHYQVTSIPVVADLDGDCVPEIIFNTFRDSSFNSDGVVRAIRGDNGAAVWTASAAAYRTDGTANPAVADVDGDGRLEVYIANASNAVLAFDDRGRPLWTSDTYTGPEDSGSVTIANLDGEGPAEIVFGAAVYDATGKLVFEGTEGRGFGGQGPISCIADLDGDGRPELIAGNTAYAFTGRIANASLVGTVRFTAETPDGYCGIADLDGDGAPEVVLVASGTIYVLQGQTGATLASASIPGGGHGGAPNIADFDGDGRPDIATAGASRYVVMRYDGPAQLGVAWSAPTEDDSSSRTGSSVFDFDGDGRAEVVYNDEEFVRIYPGREPDCLMSPPGPGCDGEMTDEEILFRDLNSSRTRTEYPVIADVDGDFKAEIVFATSNEANFLDPELLGDAGIEVWRDRLDNWVSTPAIWNQHAYHITNVTLAGAVPLREPDSWTTPPEAPFNSYRRNAQGTRAAQCAPDLVVEQVRQDRSRCPTLVMQAQLVNQGCLGVGPGVVIQVVDADGDVLGQTVTTSPLSAGLVVPIEIAVTGLGADFDVRVVVSSDADDALNECIETNNTSQEMMASCRTEI